MVRQARSEATRQKIINAAIELFSEIGYPNTGLGEIIERAEMTKGALYYHFDSKEALAAAIVEEGGAAVLAAFQRAFQSPAPALEGVIHGIFVAAEVVAHDAVARTAVQLGRTLGAFSQAAARVYDEWSTAISTEIIRAHDEGDLRESLDPDAVSETILASALGTELMSSVMSGGDDLMQRLTRSWEIILPAIAADDSLPYLREFLARESLRRFEPTLSI